MNNGVPIGLRDLYYAILVEDPETGSPTYETPVKLAGALKAVVNPNSSIETLFADDGPFDTAASTGQITLEVGVADIPLAHQAVLLGHDKAGGVLIRKAGDTPPWVAVGFRSLKSNGKYRFTWLAKGKFTIPEHGGETKGDKVNFQTATMQGSFVKRDCDDEWERHTDEDDIDYVPELGANWFLSPIGAANPTEPLEIDSTVPADGASGIATGASIKFTFDRALMLSTVHTGNFILIDDATGANVACGITITTGRDEVTLKPAANLDSATTYKALVTTNVKDIYGNALAAPAVIEFTTA